MFAMSITACYLDNYVMVEVILPY